MIKNILIIITLVLLAGFIFILSFYLTRTYINLNWREEHTSYPNTESEENDLTVFSDESDNMRFVLTKLDLSIEYDPDQKEPVRNVALNNNYKLMINGGFFNTENKYAGALILNNEVISRPAPLDTQLSHVVVLNRSTKHIDYVPTTEFLPSLSYDLAFQTGPLFIDNNIIQTEYIDNSVNGNGAYQRSFFGTTSAGEFIIGITLDKVTLPELAEKLLSHEEFNSKTISVINLDGGSSVALYLGDGNESNYGQYKTLPILIGFR